MKIWSSVFNFSNIRKDPLRSYLEHPGSEPMIQQHIKTQDLEASTTTGVVGEASVVVMFEDGVSWDQNLYYQIFNIIPHLFCVVAVGLEVFLQSGQLSDGRKTA